MTLSQVYDKESPPHGGSQHLRSAASAVHRFDMKPRQELQRAMKKIVLTGNTETPRFGGGSNSSTSSDSSDSSDSDEDVLVDDRGAGRLFRRGVNVGILASATRGQRNRGSSDRRLSELGNGKACTRWRIRSAGHLLLAGATSLVCILGVYELMATGTSTAAFLCENCAVSLAGKDRPFTPDAKSDHSHGSSALYLPTAQPRWTDTPSGQVCHSLFPWGSFPRDSFHSVWDAVRPFVLNESYHPFHEYNPKNPDDREALLEFRRWTSSLFNFYTYERLKRSQAHPAPVASVRKILLLAQDRIRDPDKYDPVRIAVMGGSVAVGRGSQLTPFPFTVDSRLCNGECSYVPRLHHLLNTVIFPSEHDNRTFPVFEVLNLAAGGTSSEVGAMALKYHLIPQIQHKPPHILLSSYSANDSRDPDPIKMFRVDQQAFVRAAHNLMPCDDDLPLVVLADDYYGWPRFAETALEQTGSIYKTASFHNVMATVFSNVVRHWYAKDLSQRLDLFGSTFEPHLGMGFHYGQSWTLFFNLLAAFHDACAEIALEGPDNDDGRAVGENPTNRGEGSWNRTRTRWQLEELPTKYRGVYRSSLRVVNSEWKENVEAKELRCQPQNHSEVGSADSAAASAASISPYRTNVCEYAWMANKATPFIDPGAVRRAMNYILVRNQGWTVSCDEIPGVPERIARTGWVTNTSNASFAVEIKDLRQAVTSFTVLAMKSYGPDWIDSKLRATVDVVPREGPTVSSGSLEIEGYHETQMSVNFPHRLSIADGGAKVGDTIRVAFELVQGQTFKISGLAFCQLDED